VALAQLSITERLDGATLYQWTRDGCEALRIDCAALWGHPGNRISTHGTEPCCLSLTARCGALVVTLAAVKAVSAELITAWLRGATVITAMRNVWQWWQCVPLFRSRE
jgi:hypothetical protein